MINIFTDIVAMRISLPLRHLKTECFYPQFYKVVSTENNPVIFGFQKLNQKTGTAYHLVLI